MWREPCNQANHAIVHPFASPSSEVDDDGDTDDNEEGDDDGSGADHDDGDV